MNKVEIQFTTSVDRLLSFCGHAVLLAPVCVKGHADLGYLVTAWYSNFRENAAKI